MSEKTEGMHAGEFVVSEANGDRSREVVTVVTGQVLKAGHVMGKTITGTGAAVAYAGNTGNGAMGAITVGGKAKAGPHKLTIIEPGVNVGTFQVEDPDGVVIGTGVVAAAFSAGGLAFTLADGAADFVAGDGFTITVTVTATKYKEYNPANTDGSEIAVAVCYDNTDATAADKSAVAIVRDAEINSDELTWFVGASGAQKTAGLANLAVAGIIGRSSV